MTEPVIIGRATLYNADCRDILPTLGKVDAVVTDPPYGIGEARKKSSSRVRPTREWKRARDLRNYDELEWDDDAIQDDLVDAVLGAADWAVIFGGNFYKLPPTRCWLVWDKMNSGDFADCELAWTNLPKAVRRIQYMWNGMIREKGAQRGDHPTQKPLEVMKWCIGHVPEPNDVILDPFAGSGTTGVAAVQMGKAFIGIEREERYFEAMCRRIREANGDDVGPLFGEAA
jgi:site-specific DNA-methyltransferase (adenine-specific)/modification methylase